MKGVCPCCSASASIEAFLNDAEAREAVKLAASLPAHLGPLVLRYIALFRPAKRQLSWPRARKLLTEVAEMINTGQVLHRGRSFPATHALFERSMTQMLNSPSIEPPLSNHNYLLKIIAGDSPREQSALESATEDLKRQASNARQGSKSQAAAEWAGEIAARKRLGEAAPSEAERQQFFRDRGVEP